MSLDLALQDAMTGLRATQAQIQVLSANVANAQTPGYSEETAPESSITTPAGGIGVETGVIQRVSNQLLTANLATQTSAASAASATNNYLTQLQNLLGQVGGNSTFTNALNTFVGAMQTDAATPEDPVAQSATVNAGQQLAQQLNSFSSGVQSLRANTDAQIATDVTTVNSALNSIAQLNTSIVQLQAEGQSVATLQDQRDQAVNQVAQLVSVSTYTRADGTMVVMNPSSGRVLVDRRHCLAIRLHPIPRYGYRRYRDVAPDPQRRQRHRLDHDGRDWRAAAGARHHVAERDRRTQPIYQRALQPHDDSQPQYHQ